MQFFGPLKIDLEQIEWSVFFCCRATLYLTLSFCHSVCLSQIFRITTLPSRTDFSQVPMDSSRSKWILTGTNGLLGFSMNLAGFLRIPKTGSNHYRSIGSWREKLNSRLHCCIGTEMSTAMHVTGVVRRRTSNTPATGVLKPFCSTQTPSRHSRSHPRSTLPIKS